MLSEGALSDRDVWNAIYDMFPVGSLDYDRDCDQSRPWRENDFRSRGKRFQTRSHKGFLTTSRRRSIRAEFR